MSFHVLKPTNSQSPGGLIVPPGQVRYQLQLRRLYRPTVAGGSGKYGEDLYPSVLTLGGCLSIRPRHIIRGDRHE
jgi:hypothetical protein